MLLLKTGAEPGSEDRLELARRYDDDVPPYAILSHTWSSNADDEVLFVDVQAGSYKSKPAYPKVAEARKRARLDGLEYIWIDNCCIDKSSSAELSEAINSMYTYYQDARVCYVYLADVEAGPSFGDEFEHSRWWKRGWTLQELLAPEKLIFFSKSWEPLGTKQQLFEIVVKCSGVDEEYISGLLTAEDASVAMRMSWAARRETTRAEDMAYCLIGLFSVNMPMLYGEGGPRAFLRLQEEIMRSNDDHTLFVWMSADSNRKLNTTYHGLLADSPVDFLHTGRAWQHPDQASRKPFTMTNRGLNIHLQLSEETDSSFTASLRCYDFRNRFNGLIGVHLERLDNETDQYARVAFDQLANIQEPGNLHEVYVRQNYSRMMQGQQPWKFYVRDVTIPSDASQAYGGSVKSFAYRRIGDDETKESVRTYNSSEPLPTAFKMIKKAGALTVALYIEHRAPRENFCLLLGALSDFEPGFTITKYFAGFSLMKREFRPQPFDDKWRELPTCHVRVKVTEDRQPHQKLFILDIEIEPKRKLGAAFIEPAQQGESLRTRETPNSRRLPRNRLEDRVGKNMPSIRISRR